MTLTLEDEFYTLCRSRSSFAVSQPSSSGNFFVKEVKRSVRYLFSRYNSDDRPKRRSHLPGSTFKSRYISFAEPCGAEHHDCWSVGPRST
ncbi:hypothetical protein LCGC14_2804410 [marine sediment metagenome]|uniref:Uncharacterized protein n=1 Tax=marine sediment metagenome TaxID=412755 RepID=A0A0F9BD28_9ZZZZ